MLPRRAAAVSYNMQDPRAEQRIGELDVADLKGRDELGILAGTLLAFARAMGEFGASLMVAGSIPQQTQTLSMAIYDAVQAGQDDLALVLVIVTSVLSITVLVLSNRFLSPR